MIASRWNIVEVDLFWLSVGVLIGILAGSLAVLLLRLDFWIMKYREFHQSLTQLKRELAALRETKGLQPQPSEALLKEDESVSQQQRSLDYLDEMRDELDKLREEIRRSLRRSA